MSNDLPLVSVITPVYNGAKYLDELIQSVLSQDYPRVEHIIIDDGSTDGGATLAILKSYPHLRWHSRPNKGQYATMNEGLAMAKGEYVTFISADDKYAGPHAVSVCMNVVLEDPAQDVVYGETISIDENGNPYRLECPQTGPLWMFRYYPRILAHCSLFVRKDYLAKNSIIFDESLVYAGDYDWLSKLLLSGGRFFQVRHSVAAYRIHSAQISNRLGSPERMAELQKLNRLYPKNCFLRFIVHRWVTLVQFKNCYQRAGISGIFEEIYSRFKSQKTR